jgi:hypothetical protein
MCCSCEDIRMTWVLLLTGTTKLQTLPTPFQQYSSSPSSCLRDSTSVASRITLISDYWIIFKDIIRPSRILTQSKCGPIRPRTSRLPIFVWTYLPPFCLDSPLTFAPAQPSVSSRSTATSGTTSTKTLSNWLRTVMLSPSAFRAVPSQAPSRAWSV